MAIVESSSQSVSIESFSYSWLINLKPSLESVSDSFRAAMDSSDESSFIDMYPNMPPSRRFKRLNTNVDFDSDHPFVERQSVTTTAHGKWAKAEEAKGENGRIRSGSLPKKKLHCYSLRRCRCLLSQKLLEKYLYFLRPLLEKIRCCRRSGRAGDNRIWTVKNRGVYSPQVSPRTSVGSSIGDWRRSCDSESSIHDAVLHCKRSIGM